MINCLCNYTYNNGAHSSSFLFFLNKIDIKFKERTKEESNLNLDDSTTPSASVKDNRFFEYMRIKCSTFVETKRVLVVFFSNLVIINNYIK